MNASDSDSAARSRFLKTSQALSACVVVASLPEILRLVAGKTEKPFGVDPARHFDAGQAAHLYLGRVPLVLFRENENGPRYDGTVDADRVQAYMARDPSDAPPIIATLSPRSGWVNVLDGGHRISAARLRGDREIYAVVSVKGGLNLLRASEKKPSVRRRRSY